MRKGLYLFIIGTALFLTSCLHQDMNENHPSADISSSTSSRQYKDMNLSIKNRDTQYQKVPIDNMNFFDSDYFIAEDILDDHILYFKRSETDKDPHRIFDSEILTLNTTTQQLDTIYTFPPKTSCIKAAFFRGGVLISQSIKIDREKDAMSLLWTDGQTVKIIAECEDLLSIVKDINFEIFGNTIVYNTLEDGKIKLHIYDAEENLYVDIDNEYPLLDNHFVVNDYIILTFQDATSNAKFITYDFNGMVKNEVDFDTNYRLYDYNLYENTILLCVKHIEHQEAHLKTHGIMLIELEGSRTSVVNIDGRFSIYRNNEQVIMLHEGKIYEFESSNSEMILNDLGLGFELYLSSFTILFDKNDVYVAGQWMDKKYDVETCMYTFSF